MTLDSRSTFRRLHRSRASPFSSYTVTADRWLFRLVVDAVVELGARRAGPGEFSQRAYLNDKLDLVQGGGDLRPDQCGNRAGGACCVAFAVGPVLRLGWALADQLSHLRMHVEAAIDFPEEEIDFLSDDLLLRRLNACADAFQTLLLEAKQGRVLRDGFQVVIVGRPNAGKSSLLNLLSGQDSAIVTEVAGTTRDVLREQIDIDGLAVELIDTAGLRDDPDRIEQEGIRRARNALSKADAVLWILDATEEHHELNEKIPGGVPVLKIRNKADLTGEAIGAVDEHTMSLSAKTGEGLESLREHIRRLAGYENLGEGAFTARKRQLDALERAATHFDSGRTALEEAQAGELLAEELRLSHQNLGEITGAVSSDELLGRIFSEFCIGK